MEQRQGTAALHDASAWFWAFPMLEDVSHSSALPCLDFVENTPLVEVRLLRLLPAAEDFVDREQVYFWKVRRIFLCNRFEPRTVMVPRHYLLAFRTVEIFQIGFGQCSGAMPFGDFI